MKRSEKIAILSEWYETSTHGIRLMIQQGGIEGAFAVKNKTNHTYQFCKELNAKFETWRIHNESN